VSLERELHPPPPHQLEEGEVGVGVGIGELIIAPIKELSIVGARYFPASAPLIV
jgi:hypothetical protein